MKRILLTSACAAMYMMTMAQYTHQVSAILSDEGEVKKQNVYDAEGRLIQRLCLSLHYGKTEYDCDSILTRTYEGDKMTQVLEKIFQESRIVTIEDKNSLTVEYHSKNGDAYVKTSEDITVYDDEHRPLNTVHNDYGWDGTLSEWNCETRTYTYEGNIETILYEDYYGSKKTIITHNDAGLNTSVVESKLTDQYTKTKEWVDVTKTTYEYDSHNNMTKRIRLDYWDYDYDINGYVANETTTVEVEATHTYDANGNLTQSVYNDERVASYNVTSEEGRSIVLQLKRGEEYENDRMVAYDLTMDHSCIRSYTNYSWRDGNWEPTQTKGWNFSNTLLTSQVAGAVQKVDFSFPLDYTGRLGMINMEFSPKMAMVMVQMPGDITWRGTYEDYIITPISALPAVSDGKTVVVPMADGTHLIEFEAGGIAYLIDDKGEKQYYVTLSDAVFEYDPLNNFITIKNWQPYTEPDAAAGPRMMGKGAAEGIVAGKYSIVFPNGVLSINGEKVDEIVTTVEVDESIDTGISTISHDRRNAKPDIYNLQGAKVKSPAKGQIVIIDGKKVMK
ncbi:MAG: hypothetical protein KBT20_10820 [Bacteroidales bacterium]|nr:hypothetical protein [Candidatus Liminaster caballi]